MFERSYQKEKEIEKKKKHELYFIFRIFNAAYIVEGP